MIKLLPSNYNFEIHKSIWRIEELKKSLKKDKIRLILQMPQGLQMFACALSDIFEHFTDSEVSVKWYINNPKGYNNWRWELWSLLHRRRIRSVHKCRFYNSLWTQLPGSNHRYQNKGIVCVCRYLDRCGSFGPDYNVQLPW